jgi:cytidylate kinase
MAIISISRDTFSGGKKFAERIAGKLGYRCVSGEEVLAGAARQYGIPEEKLYEVLMKKPGGVERAVGNTVERFRYLHCIRATLCQEAQGDNIVYHGHAGHLLLEGVEHLIKVRVVAQMEYRIKAAMKRNNLNEEEAVELLRRTDEDRAIWTRFIYHVNRQDSSLYDLVFNLDHIDIETACDTVCRIAVMEEYQATPESQKFMDDLALGSHVRAILATHKEIEDGNLRVEACRHTITIWGTVGSLIDADRVRTVAWGVPGVEEINSKMRIKSPVFTMGSVY